MLTWPSIIGCALARIYDLLRRRDAPFLGFFLRHEVHHPDGVGVLEFSELDALLSLTLINTWFGFEARFDSGTFGGCFFFLEKLASSIFRATAFFICCILIFRVLLLFGFGGGTAFLASSIAFIAAFLAAFAAGVFRNFTLLPCFVVISTVGILLYKGGENYSCASAFASAFA